MYNQENLNKAWFFASKAHKEQQYPGENLPYLTHVGQVMMEVMRVASELENPELALLCAILHDTIEDTMVSHEELTKLFSLEVANGVQALSKDSTLATKKERMVDSLERIKTQAPEIWVVKLADRIANLGKPPHHWSQEKRKAYQEEGQVILDYLGEANANMAQRLAEKIEAYGDYVVFSTRHS